MLHPTTSLLAWIAFAIVMPWLGIPALIVASALTMVMVRGEGVEACWRLVRRTRILLIALIVLYAFATPGVPLVTVASWGPTAEGLRMGGLQAWRLLLMMAALAALLTRMNRDQLLAGIYVMLLPAKHFGFPIERIAVRLWLTLHYAETTPKAASLNARWESALTLPSELPANISLEVPAFSLRDAGFLIGFGTMLAAAVW